MHLEDARTTIISSVGRMNALFQATVFDEWVLVRLSSEQGAILAYQGPRADSYKAEFLKDLAPLRTELGQERLEIGGFAFVGQARGTHFDACIRLGKSSYLFCNHTQKTMDEIRQSPRWITAQKPFVELSNLFVTDPLE
jgi:hypothetical protein|uniref:hypothetical protein n=1 Tax=Cephaloticoccus sp. TaxID=1985742 RepID=UPI00404B2C85